MKLSRAFTLLELLITIAIMAALLIASTISFSNIIERNKAGSECTQIVSALQLARSEAITRNTEVIFCKSKDHKTCGGEWGDGQILLTKDSELIRIFYFSSQDSLVWDSSLGKDDAITFNPTGATNGQQGSFYYCPKKSKENAIAIILEQTGRVRTTESNRCA